MLATRSLRQQSLHSRSKAIGFIGLGAMGREMATNLLSKTFQATKDEETTFIVYDTFGDATTRFLKDHSDLFPGRRITIGSSPADVAKSASTIITMVPSSPQVKEVYLAEGGILQGLKSLQNPTDPSSSTLCIDCTTLDPLVAVQASEQVRHAGNHGSFDMLDAPVSGGVVGARAGTLSFMVGSNSHQSFAMAEPTLLKMGSRAIHCGKNGNGLIAKIANNLLLGISMLATSEAMLLGTTHGLSPQILAHIINTSTGRNWSSEINNPAPGALHGTDKSPPAERDYEGGFATKLQAKDLGLAMTAAQQEGIPVPLGQLATTIYQALGSNPEYMNKDFSVAFKALSTAVGRMNLGDDVE
ncbi:hypothetical protein CBS101457_000496 [Exobasidium rhododendri]|nr:hypothetical protein CBS101457_000496 [Exobasidium rhododendri]